MKRSRRNSLNQGQEIEKAGKTWIGKRSLLISLLGIVIFAFLFSVILANFADATPAINFTSLTPANGTITSATSVVINISITNASDLNQFTWNWNGTNYTFYNNSLVFMMNLDNVSAIGENATKVVDVSLNSVNGTVFNAVFNATGKYGGAYQFNGVNAWINGSKSATNTVNNWAMAAWINPAKLPQGNASESVYAVYNGNDGNGVVGGYGFGIGNGAGIAGSKLQVLFGTVAYIDGGYTFPAANNWYYVVVTRVSGTTYIYVNGVQTNTSALVPGLPNNTLSIGCQLSPTNSPWRYFNGSVDEVRIWNRSLSAVEIQQQYNSNLYKYDIDKWVFTTNQTNLTTAHAFYTYQGCAKDNVGNQNCTETRILYTDDWTPPAIIFTDPTPDNGTITSNTSVIVNISMSDISGISEFTWNWNGTNYTFYNNSLVLMLNLDNVSAIGESATKAVDVSNYSNNGTLTNSPAWTINGKYGKALNFAGTTYVTTGITGFSASTGTVLMWIKPNKDLRTVTQALFDTKPSAVNALRVYSMSDNTLHYETGGSTALTWTIPSDWTGQWHQIGLNWSGSSTSLIVDGSVVASGSNIYAPGITTFEIGRYNSGSNFNGTIDEVRAYNRVLSPTEIQRNYYSNLYKYDTNTWAFYTNQTNLTLGKNYTYQGCAKDSVGNQNCTETRTLIVSAIPPTTNLISPLNNNLTTSVNINFTCNATDDIKLTNITFYWNYSGSFIANGTVNVSGISNSTTFARTNLNNGAILWNCLACNNASLCTFALANWTVTIDSIAPTINFTLLTETSGTTINRNNIVVNVTASDSGSGLKNITINLYNSTGTLINSTNSTTSPLFINFTGLANGLYYFNATAYDLAGNANSTETRNVTINTNVPLWSNPSINATIIYNGDVVKFNTTWTNAQLAGYIFAINQTGSWVNSSYTAFSGATNVSENVSLITANAGTTVYWYFWANDSAGNSNQISIQNFTVQSRPTSLTFSVNQTVYHQGRTPGGELQVYIPFEARYLDNNGQPISGATCNVTNDKTFDITSLTYNSTTGNYTGQVNDYMMYDVVNFSASCSGANYNSAANSTTTNVWLYYYLWEWTNTSYGSDSVSTTHWLRKEQPLGPLYTLTQQANTTIGSNLIEEFPFCGLSASCSMTKNFNFIGTHTARLNISINDSQCKPFLCVAYKDWHLNLLAEHCGAEQSILADIPTVIENNISFNRTFIQGSYFFIKLYLNCSSPVAETVNIYYNYTNEPANFESHHAEPTAVTTTLAGHTQLDANYTIGPNSMQNIYRKTWISFNNSASNPLYSHYFHNPRILVEYNNITIVGTIHIYNSTGQLLASDNVSAGAPNNATFIPSTNQIIWDTEYIQANTVINETLVRVDTTALRDVESLIYNTSSEKRWNVTVWTIFTPQITIYNVTVWTNYSAYNVPDNFEFKVNVTNSSGTFDISNQVVVNTTDKTIIMPTTDLSEIIYTVTATDTTSPAVHLISPANNTITNQSAQTFGCNITNIAIANLTLYIWNSTGDLNYTNTTALTGTFNSTNWTFTLPYDGTFKWNCLGKDAQSNSNWSAEGNYTIMIDTVAPVISIISPLNQTYTTEQILINFTADSYQALWYYNETTNVTYTTPVYVNVSEGSHTFVFYANDTAGNLNSTPVTFFIDSILPTINFTSPTETSGITFTNRNNIVVNVTANDTNLANITIFLYNSTSLVNSSTSTSSPLFVNFTGLANGLYFFNATAYDNASNSNSTETRNITINTTAPDTTSPVFTNLANQTILDNQSLAYDIDATDLSGVSCFTVNDTTNFNINCTGFLRNATALSIGMYWLNITVNDTLNNLNSGIIYINVTNATIPDITPPASITNLNNQSSGQTWMYWNWTNPSDSDFNSTIIYINSVNVANLSVNYYNATGLTCGTSYTMTIYTKDNSENINNTDVNSTASTPACSDTIYPVFSNYYDNDASLIDSGTGLFNVTVQNTNGTVWIEINNINITAINLTSNVYNSSYNFTLGGAYPYRWWAYGNGTNNLINQSGTRYYTVNTTITDITPPNVAIIYPQNTSYNVNVSELNYTVYDANLQACWYSLNNGLANITITCGQNATGLTSTEGSNTWIVWANDTAGNTNSSSITFFKDTIPPSISILSPANQTYGNTTILVYFSSNGANVWWFNGTENETYTSAVYRTFPEGSNTIIAYANDSLGNLNSASVAFGINTSLPSVVINSPQNISYNNRTILIDISSNGNSTWYNWNGTNVSYITPVNVTFNEGSNTLTAYTNNSLGLENFARVTFTIDTIPPTISIISPENITYNGTSILVNISSDGDYIWYNWNETNTTYTTPVYVTFDNGSNTLTAYANDSFGNLNSSSVVFYAFPDTDSDGVPDYADYLFYNESKASTSGLTLFDVMVNGNTDIDSNGWPGVNMMVFYDNNVIFMNFTHNFSINIIDLSKVSIEKTSLGIVVNLSGQFASGEKKTMYVDDNNFVTLCVKDSEVTSVSQISADCNLANETDFTSCLGNAAGVTINNIVCYDEGARIRIENLTYSGIRGTQAAPAPMPAPIPIVSGGCLTNWTCSDWGACINGSQIRDCTKIIEYCYADPRFKPNESQNCITPVPEEKITLEISKKPLPSKLLTIIFFFLLIALLLAGIYLLLRKYWAIIFEKAKELIGKIITEISKLYEKEKPGRVSGLLWKKVYTDDGDFFGTVEDIILKNYRIYGLKIRLGHKDSSRCRIKRVLLPYHYVTAVGDIIFIDKKVLDKLNSMEND